MMPRLTQSPQQPHPHQMPRPHPNRPANSAADAKSGAKPDAKPAPQDDLKTLPMAEVEKKLESSPDGLTDAEAKKRLTQYGPNELVEEKTNLLLEIPRLFLGADSVDD